MYKSCNCHSVSRSACISALVGFRIAALYVLWT